MSEPATVGSPKTDPKNATHGDVLNLFAPGDLAGAIGATYAQVLKWRERGRIPAEWWGRVARAAKAAKHRHVTYEMLERAAPSPATNGERAAPAAP